MARGIPAVKSKYEHKVLSEVKVRPIAPWRVETWYEGDDNGIEGRTARGRNELV